MPQEIDDECILDIPDIKSADDLPTMHWKRRMYWANIRSNFHACLAFIFGVEPRTKPARIIGHAMVTSDGFITANCIGPDGSSHMGAFVGSMDDFIAEMLRACEFSRLNNDERKALEDALNEWVTINYGSHKFVL